MTSKLAGYAKFAIAILGAFVTVLGQIPAGADTKQIISAILSTGATALAVVLVPNKEAGKRAVPGDAKAAYEAYGEATNHKNYLGEPMPQWEDLPTEIRSAWRAAAGSVNG